MNEGKNFVPSPAQFPEKPWEQQTVQERMGMPAAPAWLTQPTLESALIERIRGGGTLEEIKEYYRFMKEIKHDQAMAEFMAAMAQAQQAMTTISRDMDNAQTRSKYASLDAVDRATRPHYSPLGIVVTFDTKPSEKGDTWIKVIAEVGRGIFSKQHSIDMPADGIGAKGGAVMTRTHATMSAITYGRRQLLKNIFNLAEADDDGNAAAGRSSDDFDKPISAEQVETLTKLIAASGRTLAAFNTAWKIEELGQLTVGNFANAERALKRLGADYAAKNK